MITKNVILFISFLSLFGCDLFDDDDPEPLISEQQIDYSNSQSKVGCYVSGYSNVSSFGNKGVTFYDNYYDQKFNEEVVLQGSFFGGIPARVFVLYEPTVNHKNAYASPTGEILFGYHMFYYTVSTYGELAAAGVLAHEWGHRVQQSQFGNIANPLAELEADAFSGLYMGLAKLWDWNQIRGYFANVYATGDYNFNSPDHHGTHDQRLAAAYLGLSTAISISQSGSPMTYSQMHNLFTNEINSSILSKTVNNKINYSDEYISKSQIEDVKKISSGINIDRNVRVSDQLSIDDVRKLWPVE